MWTVCWIDGDGNDKWDRLGFKEEVGTLVAALVQGQEVDLNSIVIFPPETEVLIETFLTN